MLRCQQYALHDSAENPPSGILLIYEVTAIGLALLAQIPRFREQFPQGRLQLLQLLQPLQRHPIERYAKSSTPGYAQRACLEGKLATFDDLKGSASPAPA